MRPESRRAAVHNGALFVVLSAMLSFANLWSRVAIMLVMLSASAGVHAADYPYPLERLSFDSQRQSLHMAYMDVPEQGEARGTFVLLHGKNFNGAYWGRTIDFLSRQGFRVVVPDQIGFGESSLPKHYQFSFAQLAANTKGLLDALELSSVRVLGHSMGGMLATRFALQYPESVEQLILLNPIGLEDWRAMGVPHVAVEQIYAAERGKDFESIQAYQQASYYDGVWKDAYTPWARMLADAYKGRDGKRFAWNMTLTADMILSQPVVYQFDQLRVPVVLMVGLRARTAIGRNLVDDSLAQRMGDYPTLTRRVAGQIPEVDVITFDGIGHLPHIEAPKRFLAALGGVIKP